MTSTGASYFLTTWPDLAARVADRLGVGIFGAVLILLLRQLLRRGPQIIINVMSPEFSLLPEEGKVAGSEGYQPGSLLGLSAGRPVGVHRA